MVDEINVTASWLERRALHPEALSIIQVAEDRPLERVAPETDSVLLHPGTLTPGAVHGWLASPALEYNWDAAGFIGTPYDATSTPGTFARRSSSFPPSRGRLEELGYGSRDWVALRDACLEWAGGEWLNAPAILAAILHLLEHDEERPPRITESALARLEKSLLESS